MLNCLWRLSYRNLTLAVLIYDRGQQLYKNAFAQVSFVRVGGAFLTLSAGVGSLYITLAGCDWHMVSLGTW